MYSIMSLTLYQSLELRSVWVHLTYFVVLTEIRIEPTRHINFTCSAWPGIELLELCLQQH